MIPKKLRFQAFGSYVDEQIIDFDELSDGGMILFHGKTGSGKSTILDALTCALYGCAAGLERGSFYNMRSRNLGIDKSFKTIAELEFEAKDSVFKVARVYYERVKSTGTIEKKYEAELLRLNSEGVFEPVFQNPTIKEVNKEIEEILGLNHDQFVKTVILPQGKFESFLTADSAKKEELLTTLFHIGNWEKITEELGKELNNINRDNKGQSTFLSNSLKRLGCENRAELDEKIEEKKREFSEKSELSIQLEKALKKLTEEYTTAQETAKEFAQYDSLKLKLSELQKKAPFIDVQRKILSRHTFAQLTEASYMQYATLAKRREELRNHSEKLGEELAKTKEELDVLSSRKAEVLADEERVGKLKAYVARLESLRESYTAKSEILHKMSANKALREEASVKLQNASAQLLQCEDELKLVVDEKERVTGLAPQLAELRAQVLELEGTQKLVLELEKYQNVIAQLKLELEVAQDKQAQLKKELDKLKSERSQLQKRHLENVASVLAEEMVDGEPCPVCGNVHHPNPASSAEHIDFSEKLEELDGKISKCEDEVTAWVEKCSKLKGRIENGGEYVATQKKDIAQREEFSEELLKRKSAELKAYEEAYNGLSKLIERVKTLEEARTKLSEINKACQAQIAELDKSDFENSARLEVITKSLVAEIATAEQLEERLEACSLEIVQIEQKTACVRNLTAEKEKKLSADSALFEKNASDLKRCENEIDEAEATLAVTLKKNGFADISEYLEAVISEEKAGELHTQIEEFDENFKLFTSQHEELAQRLDGVVRVDVAKAEQRLGEVKQQKATADEEKIRTDELVKTLVQEAERYDKSAEELAVKTAEHEKLSAFLTELRGDKTLGIHRYVLAVMFDSVLAEANRLLSEIKGGQFRLRNEASKKGGRKTGLDLFVESSRTATPYSVGSLSGGEKFLVAISLSMALSTIVQMQSGGVRVEAMFIDEGFGSLDPQALDEVMQVLHELRGSRKFLGIISHVEGLKSIIPNKIEATNGRNGSQIKIVKD